MWWVLLAVAVVAVVALLLWRGGGRPARGRIREERARMLETAGAARCLAAIELLDDLARRRDAALLAETWDRIELPLLEALPDCPPDRKAELMRALERCHASTRQRDVQRRLMTMRNAVG